METVTFETAKRLKEAGFPQPEFLFGQFWYAPNGTLCIIAGDGFYPGEIRVTVEGGNSMYLKRYDLVFAPTATGILRGMPGFEIKYSEMYDGWVVSNLNGNGTSTHQNPHETAALAWLKTQSK